MARSASYCRAGTTVARPHVFPVSRVTTSGLTAEGRVFRKAKSVVGLDIGSSTVKAVELKPSGKGHRVAAFAAAPVPPDAIVDGAIIDAGAVADSIRKVFEAGAFKGKDVCASLSGNAVIVKKITLPVMTATELHDSIQWEAEQYIPFDIQDVNLAYQVLDQIG